MTKFGIFADATVGDLLERTCIERFFDAPTVLLGA